MPHMFIAGALFAVVSIDILQNRDFSIAMMFVCLSNLVFAFQ